VFGVVAVVVVIVAAALVIAASSPTSHTSSGSGTASSGATTGSTLPDLTLDPAAGTVTGDEVVDGAAGPVLTPGLDVRYLSFRDPTQGLGGPQLSVQVVRDTDAGDSNSVAYGEGGDQAEAATVNGRPAYLTVLGPVVLLGVPPDATVTDGLLLVGYQLSEPQVLRVAEGLQRGADGTWRATAPPDGLAQVSSGVDSAPSDRNRTITISPAGATGGQAAVEVVVREGDEGSFEGLLRDRVAKAQTVAAATVTGQPAALVTLAGGTGERSIVWRVTPTAVAELRGTVSEAQILAVAAGLRLAGG
jgi:hypothetical protein